MNGRFVGAETSVVELENVTAAGSITLRRSLARIGIGRFVKRT